jgi:hypothetical protein
MLKTVLLELSDAHSPFFSWLPALRILCSLPDTASEKLAIYNFSKTGLYSVLRFHDFFASHIHL